MDYKELIKELRFLSLHVPEQMCDDDGTSALDKAADAIETLLAERDAAMDDLKGRCDICKHRRVCIFDEQHRIGCANSKRGHWQWRGPQKERQ